MSLILYLCDIICKDQDCHDIGNGLLFVEVDFIRLKCSLVKSCVNN